MQGVEMNENTQTVMGIYEAFGRGDVEHILAQLADDVAWDQGIRPTGLDYLEPGVGKEHVARFFQRLTGQVEFTTFEPLALCSNDDTVIATVREAGRNILTGAPIAEDTVVHVFAFDDAGKVVSFRHIADFAHHEAAANARPASALS
jgi:ketosteroid isomerase-like protein